MVSKQSLAANLSGFIEVWGAQNEFTAQDFVNVMKVPRGTASSSFTHLCRQGQIVSCGGRPRRYRIASSIPSDINALLDIVADIDAKGIKRSTLAPLLTWIAQALTNA